MIRFSERLRKFRDLHRLSDAELGRRLGVSGQHVGQMIRGEKKHSRPLEVLLEHLEQKASMDPFLSACEKILQHGSERVLQGFTMNIQVVMAAVDPEESKRLIELETQYLEERRGRKRKARDAG